MYLYQRPVYKHTILARSEFLVATASDRLYLMNARVITNIIMRPTTGQITTLMVEYVPT